MPTKGRNAEKEVPEPDNQKLLEHAMLMETDALRMLFKEREKKEAGDKNRKELLNWFVSQDFDEGMDGEVREQGLPG